MTTQRNSASHNFIVKHGSNTRLCFPCSIIKRGERNVKVKWPSKIGSTGKSIRARKHASALQLQSAKEIISCSTHVHTHKKTSTQGKVPTMQIKHLIFSDFFFSCYNTKKKTGKITIRYKALCKTARSVSF